MLFAGRRRCQQTRRTEYGSIDGLGEFTVTIDRIADLPYCAGLWSFPHFRISALSMVRRHASARSHARTRRDHASEMAEDYVEAIDDLVQGKGTCRVVDLARRFGVTHVTVSRTTQRLVRDGLAETQPYGPITLTEQGRKLANASRQRHKIVLSFLRTLGVCDAVAEVDSEGIEHHCSDETLQRMKQFISTAQSRES